MKLALTLIASVAIGWVSYQLYLKAWKAKATKLAAHLGMDAAGDHGWMILSSLLNAGRSVYSIFFWAAFIVFGTLGSLVLPYWVGLFIVLGLYLFKLLLGPFRVIVAVDADRVFIAHAAWFSGSLRRPIVDEAPRGGWFDFARRKPVGLRIVYHAASGTAVAFTANRKQRNLAEDLATRFSVPSPQSNTPTS